VSKKRQAKVSRNGAASGLRAVILAGGKGVRLQPYTVNFPKPLVPLVDKPIIEVLIRQLIGFGITDVTLTLGHFSELIKAYFSQRSTLLKDLRLRYVVEEEPTGTAGSLSMISGLTKTFLVMNGDLLTDLDIHELVAFHHEQDAALTIATHMRHVKIDLGVLEFSNEHRVTGYIEKPEKSYHVSMGIYVYEPRVLRYIEPGKYLDFPNLVLRLLERGEKVCAFPSRCLWLDIGRPDDYARAQDLYQQKQSNFERI
jgi:NDP-sugar pyrophosphorylase family protein